MPSYLVSLVERPMKLASSIIPLLTDDETKGKDCMLVIPESLGVISSRAGTTTSTSVDFFIPYFSQNSFCCCSVTKSCPTLCDLTDCSTPGSLSFSISQSLLKLMSINRWYHTSISSSVTPFFCPQSLTASESFP